MRFSLLFSLFLTQLRRALGSAWIGFILACFSLISFAHAETVETGWQRAENHPPVRVNLALTGLTAERQLSAILMVELDDGWKTYWRSPGEGGIAPSLKWQGSENSALNSQASENQSSENQSSENIEAIEWLWPFPERFNILGIDTLGYQGRVTFPLHFTVKDVNQPVKLDAVLTMPSCTTVCVLQDYPLKLEFDPLTLSVNEQISFQYAQALSQVPQASSRIETSAAVWDADKQQLQLTVRSQHDWQQPQLLLDGEGERKDYHFALLGWQNKQVNGQARLRAVYQVSSWRKAIELKNQPLTLSVSDVGLLAQSALVVTSGQVGTVPRNAASFASGALPEMMLFALLGGLILNIMPCVLPVLGLKLSSVIGQQGQSLAQVRRQFLASSLGILTSFWLLALMLLVVKWSGGLIGWGIQFQSLPFLTLMFVVTAVFGANMLGLFSLYLPSGVSTWLAQRGGNHTDGHTGGHFVQGMFATLLATPCSAPFLATAVAFALGSSVLEMLVIFTFLGLGMALPWLLVAAWPALTRFLPKPGAWMEKVKWLLGGLMLASSAWLLTLLANHVPIFWVLILGLFTLVWLLAGIKRVYGVRALAIAGSVVLFGSGGSLVLASVTAQHWATPLPQDFAWQVLSDRALQSHIEQERVVFVDVTADWCISCKANKIGVLWQDPVYSTLNSPQIVKLQGDWTHPDGYVTDYLRRHGRFGIPFNIVYGPGAPQGIELPVVLTEEVVMQAIEQAQSPRALDEQLGN